MIEEIKTHCKKRSLRIGINELELSLFQPALLVKSNSKRKPLKHLISFYIDNHRLHVKIIAGTSINEEIDYIELSETLIQIQTVRNNLIVIALN